MTDEGIVPFETYDGSVNQTLDNSFADTAVEVVGSLNQTFGNVLAQPAVEVVGS